MNLLKESLKSCESFGAKHLKTIIMFLLMSFFISLKTAAISLNGYIVTNQNDTIQGFFNVSKLAKLAAYNQTQAANTELYNVQVAFRVNENDPYKFYTADSIKAFRFTYNSTNYMFRRFTLRYKRVMAGELSQNQFLCLLYSDKYHQLYRNAQIDFNNGLLSIPDNSLKYMVYYLYNPQKGIVKVEQNKQQKTISEFLLDQDFDPEFVSQLNPRWDFVDILNILKQYKIQQSNK